MRAFCPNSSRGGRSDGGHSKLSRWPPAGEGDSACVAGRSAVLAAVRGRVDGACCTHSCHAGGVISEVGCALSETQPVARVHVDFMIAVRLRGAVDEIAGHDSSPVHAWCAIAICRGAVSAAEIYKVAAPVRPTGVGFNPAIACRSRMRRSLPGTGPSQPGRAAYGARR